MLKKLRSYRWYLAATWKRHYKRLFPFVLIFLGLILVYPFIKQTVRPFYYEFIAPVYKPTLTEGLVGMVNTINPVLAKTDAEKDINSLVFRSLTKNTVKGNPIPDLAASYQIQNDKEYVFLLRNDIFWQDGPKFTAEDVVYTIKIIADPNYHSSYYNIFKDVTAEKISDFQVKVTLKEKYSPFLSFTDFGILPAHIPLNKYRPIGTGGFKVVELKKDQALLKGTNFNILFKFYATRDLAISALKQGEIQSLGGLTANEADDLAAWPNLQIFHHNLNQRYVGLFFNLKDSKMADKNLRQALQMATPKDQIIKDTTNNHAVMANSPLPLDSWVSIYKNLRYQFNLDEAQKVLDKDGWVMSDSGYRRKDNKDLIITITTIDNRSYLDAVAVLQSTWQKIGIKVEKLTVSSSQLKDTILPSSSFQALLTLQEVQADPDQYDQWHSTQIGDSNLVKLSAPKVDKALEDGRRTLDNDQRNSSYLDFQRFLSDEAPVIFLYYPEYYYVVSKKVHGVNLDDMSLPVDRLNGISDWEVVKKFF